LRIAASRSLITIHRVRRSLPFLIIAGVFVIAVVAAIVLYRYRMEPEAPPAPTAASVTPSPLPTATVTPPPSAPSPTAAEASPIPTPTTAPSIAPAAPTAGPSFSYGRPGAAPMHVRGDPGAPVVLEEFGDFECLPCSLLWPILQKLERDYEKRLVVVFREHPLKMHHFALDAARGAEAAGLQGKFWEMHDALYRNRATWVPAAYVTPYLVQYASEIGLDVDRFKAAIDGDDVAKRIAADQDRGDSLGIDRTPVVFLNGEKLPPTDHKEDALRGRIDKALAAKAPTEPSR
jgi:predicted DsbA family dithiol-disulfide isomerase